MVIQVLWDLCRSKTIPHFSFHDLMLQSRCKLVHLALHSKKITLAKAMPRGTLPCLGVRNVIWGGFMVHRQNTITIHRSNSYFFKENVRICLASNQCSTGDHVLGRKKYHHLNHLNTLSLTLFLSLSLSLHIFGLCTFVIIPSFYVLGKSLGAF